MDVWCFLAGLAIGPILTIIYLCSSRELVRTPPYSTPGILYPIKVVLFYCLMKIRKSGFHKSKSHSAGYGAASFADLSMMERPQKLPPSVKAIDAVFFSGASLNGWGIVLAMERRPQRLSSVLVYLKVPGRGVLVPPQHPDAINFRNEADEAIFEAGGLTIEVRKPLTAWSLKYEGKLRSASNANGPQCFVKIDLDWSSSLPLFDYDADLDLWSAAKAFAREPWSRKFFANLREHHQTHYEQMGELKGNVTLDGIISPLHLPAFRDHSYGQRREWTLMHRYYFHHIFLADGSKGVVGLVCQPSTCTRLVLGHWWTPEGKGCAVTEVDFELFANGEGGRPPTDYAFTFTAGTLAKTVKVLFDIESTHYLGWDWEAKFYEVFVNYEIDGIKGCGICEWEYNNRGGRPHNVNQLDPEWTKELRLEYLTT